LGKIVLDVPISAFPMDSLPVVRLMFVGTWNEWWSLGKLSVAPILKFERNRRPRRATAGAVMVTVAGLLCGQASAFELLPHRMVYDMTLSSASTASGINNAKGAMMYRFQEACDSWTSETNVFLKLIYDEGDQVETTWSFVSWESKDGLDYRFRVRHAQDGSTIELLQGKVRRETPSSAGRVEFSLPEDAEIYFPEGTLFPMRHLINLIDYAKGGGKVFSKTVFDGASLDNPYQINALFTRPVKRAKTAQWRKIIDGEAAPKGEGPRVHHVRMAFFALKSREALPEFELDVDYRSDGVAEFIQQDFGDYALSLEPSEFEALERPKC